MYPLGCAKPSPGTIQASSVLSPLVLPFKELVDLGRGEATGRLLGHRAWLTS